MLNCKAIYRVEVEKKNKKKCSNEFTWEVVAVVAVVVVVVVVANISTTHLDHKSRQ